MTQEYTPVDWVDETPNTPGTVINKARLDQMQTAHHFADGFEEVDAVPTADPQVDYHKVVYCTVDKQFYRWTGSAWEKDIDDDTKQLLLDHEADHNNPHVVTKAQVGLGNVDNTSDADKPVSDAVQSALDDKLDDSQLVSAWQGTPDNDHIPTEKLVKDSLDGKVPMTLKTSGVWFYAQVSSGTVQYQGTSGATGGITSVPMRDSSGRIKTAVPSANDDAANKKYVDDLGALKLDDSQLVTSWGGAPSDSNIPSEKLVKDTIDGVASDLATHEADTLNPHSVTKAQVGLGNVDNKGTVSAWQGTPDNDHIPTEKLVKDALDLKIDTSTLVSAWQTTPDDSHIPSEKLVKTYIDTSLTNGSVTKVGTATLGGNLKPVYLNAGVPTAVANDFVDVASAQTIAGAKTLSDTATFTTANLSFILQGTAPHGTIPTSNDYKEFSYRMSGNNTNHGLISFITAATTGNGNVRIRMRDYAGANPADFNLFSGSEKYMTGPSRTYNASNTSDIVNIALLDAYTPMVRTTGDQTIAGTKTLSSLELNGLYNNKSVGASSNNAGYIRFYHGINATSTGLSLVAIFINGKAFSNNDMNNNAIVQFGVRPNNSSGRISFLAKGSYITAGAYAITYDTDGCADIWARVSITGADNHGMTSIKLMESSNTSMVNYFEVGDKQFYSTTDFQTNYPNAIYSS